MAVFKRYHGRTPYWEQVNPYDRSWLESTFKEEQKMRNKITIFDGDQPRPKLSELEIGELFRYPRASDPNNVYQRIAAGSTNAVLLATGVGYIIEVSKEVERISSIRITR